MGIGAEGEAWGREPDTGLDPEIRPEPKADV